VKDIMKMKEKETKQEVRNDETKIITFVTVAELTHVPEGECSRT